MVNSARPSVCWCSPAPTVALFPSLSYHDDCYYLQSSFQVVKTTRVDIIFHLLIKGPLNSPCYQPTSPSTHHADTSIRLWGRMQAV